MPDETRQQVGSTGAAGAPAPPPSASPQNAAAAPPPSPPAGPPPMAKEWYVGRGGQQQGPYDVSQIIGWLHAGQLQAADLCWKQGMSGWAALGSVPEFVAATPAPRSAGQAGAQFHAGVATARKATLGAFSALRHFALNPVGGLPEAHREIGKAGALSAGIVYFVVYEVIWLFLLLATAGGFGGAGIGLAIRAAICLAVPFLATFVALSGMRIIVGATETYHTDAFVAGIISFVMGILGLVIATLATLGWVSPMLAVFVLANSYVILVLFSAVSRIYGLAESKAAWAVPAILIVASILTYIIYRAMIVSAFKGALGGGSFGGGMPGMF